MITKISTNILIGIFSFLLFSCSNQSIKSIDQDLDGIIGQLEYDHIRLQSPDGKIPSNIRKRELAFAAKQIQYRLLVELLEIILGNKEDQ